MVQSSSILCRRSVSRSLWSAIALAVTAGVFSQCTLAQTQQDIAAEGYITSVHPPTGFDVNGEHVATSPDTGYGLIGSRTTSSDSPLHSALQVGAYVQVVGTKDRRLKSFTAKSVLFRDDWNHSLSGLGVIDKVVSVGLEPVFQADGYRIRMTSATETAFTGDLKTLADVGANTWLRYEGKHDQAGILVASRVEFIPAKPAHIKVVKGLEESDMGFERPRASLKSEVASGSNAPPYDVSDQEAVLTQDGRVRLSMFGAFGRWHKIPANQALQDRVRHVGMRLVPDYQKELPAGHRSKIHFRFYAVDVEKIRFEMCSFEGLILVPTQAVERLKNDDQLAAVLADGVAYNLERQAARTVAESRMITGGEVAGDIAGVFVPGLSLVPIIGGEVAATKSQAAMEEQRGRVALSLLADAGYDPRQAPEAWRLLAPKHPPSNLESLKYPSRSGYQLGILNLQYKAASAAP